MDSRCTPAAQQQKSREGEQKRPQDDAIAKWLASASSSALDDAFHLTPVQLSLGMSKPVVFLANVAMDFKNVYGSYERSGLTAEKMEEIQERFAGLQAAYRLHVAACSESTATAVQLHISPRMVVESDQEIAAIKKLCNDCLEVESRSSQKSLEADLIREEKAKNRKEERRRSKLKKKRERRKNSSTKKMLLTDSSTFLTETREEASAIVRKEESLNVKADRSDHEDRTETNEVGATQMPTSPLKARSLRALADTDESLNGVKIVSTAELASEPDVENLVLSPPPGIPSKDSSTASPPGIFGSYLEVARATQLKAVEGQLKEEVETLRNQLKTERAKHLEAVQQVQLKAFIAESRASAEAERADKLEKLLAEVTKSRFDVPPPPPKEKHKPKELDKAAAALKQEN